MSHIIKVKPSTNQSPTEAEREAAFFERLRREGVKVKPRDAWRETVGWAKGSKEFDEAMRLGAEWRAKVNRESIEELDGHS